MVKIPVAVRAYRERGVLRPLRDATPEPAEAGGLAPTAPAAPTITRRGVLGLTGAGALLVLVGNAGQSIGGPLREVSFLAPRRETGDQGEFPVNKTAAAAGVTAAMTGAAWELVLRADGERRLDRAALLALPQHTARLPIACVEGWSTTQEWTGVRLAELARLAGAADAGEVLVESLQARGVLRRATLSGAQLRAADALLALRVNGADLTPDHGFPARIIVPALPGVHCTKWVSTLTFRGRAA